MVRPWYLTFYLCLILDTSPAMSQDLSIVLGEVQDEYDLAGGAVVVFCADSIMESYHFGSAHFGAGIAVNAQTKFRIASISKTITAMAFMRLVEAGLCTPDDDISDWLGYSVRNPNYPDVPITPRMLLSHTSTIIDGGNYSDFLSETYASSSLPSLSELIFEEGSFYSATIFNSTVPGSYFNYSNLNYGILGTLVEAISGQRFDIYCKEQFFDPLNLDASFRVADLSDIQQLGALYRKQNGQWVIQADDFQDGFPDETFLIEYVPGTNALRYAPQGGLRISAEDLSKLMSMFLNAGSVDGVSLLSAESTEAMMAEAWTYNGSNGNNYFGLFRSWGLGMHRCTYTPNQDEVLSASSFMVGHPGEAYGLVSDAYVDPLRGIGIVFITNGCGEGYSTSGASAFYTVEKDIFDIVDARFAGSGCNADIAQVPVNISAHFHVYPNPTSNRLRISNNHGGSHMLQWYNAQGLLLGSEIYRGSAYELNLEVFPEGIYTIAVDGLTKRVLRMGE